MGSAKFPVPVAAETSNFSPIPWIAPPDFGSVTLGSFGGCDVSGVAKDPEAAENRGRGLRFAGSPALDVLRSARSEVAVARVFGRSFSIRARYDFALSVYGCVDAVAGDASLNADLDDARKVRSRLNWARTNYCSQTTNSQINKLFIFCIGILITLSPRCQAGVASEHANSKSEKRYHARQIVEGEIF